MTRGNPSAQHLHWPSRPRLACSPVVFPGYLDRDSAAKLRPGGLQPSLFGSLPRQAHCRCFLSATQGPAKGRCPPSWPQDRPRDRGLPWLLNGLRHRARCTEAQSRACGTHARATWRASFVPWSPPPPYALDSRIKHSSHRRVFISPPFPLSSWSCLLSIYLESPAPG